jgi:hypothetical protein
MTWMRKGTENEVKQRLLREKFVIKLIMGERNMGETIFVSIHTYYSPP